MAFAAQIPTLSAMLATIRNMIRQQYEPLVKFTAALRVGLANPESI